MSRWRPEAAALNGVFLQMFNHGLTAATLFWFVGLLEERSGGLRGLDDFGGLRKLAPVFCGLMGIALFSSLGLPGLNGFVGEFLIFRGAFPLAWVAATFSVLGLAGDGDCHSDRDAEGFLRPFGEMGQFLICMAESGWRLAAGDRVDVRAGRLSAIGAWRD